MEYLIRHRKAELNQKFAAKTGRIPKGDQNHPNITKSDIPSRVIVPDDRNKISLEWWSGRTDPVLLDSGADGSIISSKLMKLVDVNAKLNAIESGSFTTDHGHYTVLGEWLARFKINGTEVAARFIVVKDEVEPILGFDFLAHYNYVPNWSAASYTLTRPSDGLVFNVPMEGSPICLRSIREVKCRVGHVTLIPCKPTRQFPEFFSVEPIKEITTGALRVQRSLHSQEDCENLNSDQDVTILPGALLASAEEVTHGLHKDQEPEEEASDRKSDSEPWLADVARAYEILRQAREIDTETRMEIRKLMRKDPSL